MTECATRTPSLADFQQEVRDVLAARYPIKPASRFVWGQNSDSVGLFEEAPVEEVKRRVAETKDFLAYLWSSGLGWISGPPEYGGRGLPAEYQLAFDRITRGFVLPRRDLLLPSINVVAPTIYAYGSDVAKRAYLPKMHSGQLVGCQLFSEPACGSDLASVSTTAERNGDGWLISGQKVWTSGAHYSDLGLILCRTSSGPRYRNLSIFIVDMHAPGVDVRPLRQMTGGAEFNEVFIDSVWVDERNRVGEVGDGWRIALYTLSNERAAIGGSSSGAGLFTVDRYIQMLKAFDTAKDPVLRDQLTELICHLKISKLGFARQSALRRAGHDDSRLSSITKLLVTANYARISDFVSAVLGPRLTADSGVWGGYAWSEFVLGTPGTRLGGGTDEILRNVVGERVLGLPKEPNALPALAPDSDARGNGLTLRGELSDR